MSAVVVSPWGIPAPLDRFPICPISTVDDLVQACLKPGEVHTGPCEGERGTVKKAVKAVARKKAVPKKKTAAKPSGGRVAGRDVTGDLDYGALSQLPSKFRTGDQDMRLASIARVQGFDGTPALGTAADLDKLIAEGGRELFRGTRDYKGQTGEQLARQLRTGDAFFGTGEYGSGMYFTPDESEVFEYADFGNGGINRAVLPRDARTIDYPELVELARKAAPEAVARMQAAQQQLIDGLRDEKTRAQALATALEVNAAERVRAVAADTSIHAMAQGFDAIRLPGVSDAFEDYWIVLNRTALTVQDRDNDRSFGASAGSTVRACKPPDVAVPHPGPCEGKKGKKRARSAIKKAVRKTVAHTPPRKAVGKKAGPSRLDVGTRLDYDDLASKLDRPGSADEAMAVITARQGFDARARRVDAGELDAARDAGGVEIWRGHAGYGDVTDQMAAADFFAGNARHGIHGSGWSTTTDREAIERLGLPMTRMVLPADADVVDLDDVVARWNTQSKTALSQQRKLFKALDDANGATARETALRALQDWTARQPARERVLRDPGRFAAALGHDALRITRPGAMDRYVIVNRGKVLAERPLTAAAAVDECEREHERETELCRFPRHKGPCKKGRKLRPRSSGRRSANGVQIKKLVLPKPRIRIKIRPVVNSALDELERILGCKPPDIAVPHPGPCVGRKRGKKPSVPKPVEGLPKIAKKAVAPARKPRAKPAVPSPAVTLPKYTPPASVDAADQARATKLVRKDPHLFATVRDRFGSISSSGNLQPDEVAWLQALYEREPAFVNHLAQSARIAENQREAAKKAGVTPGQFRKDVAARLKTMFDGKPTAIRVRDDAALRDIIAGGRFKTSFEKGARRATGLSTDLKARRLGEQILGIEPDTAADRRPVYGYVAVNGIEPALSEGRKIPGIAQREGQEDLLSTYGKIQVVLKPETRARTSVTVGDSLDEMAFIRPSPLDAPTADSIRPSSLRWLGDEDWTRTGYAEAQVHGGVRSQDIAEVVFPDDPDAGTRTALDGAGIPWRVLKPSRTAALRAPQPVSFALDVLDVLDVLVEGCLPPQVPRPRHGPCPDDDDDSAPKRPRARRRLVPRRKVPKRTTIKKAAPAQPSGGPRSSGRAGEVRTSLMLAEDIDEVNATARAKAKALTGRDIPMEFGGIDVQIAREHAEGILQGLERFPHAALRSVGTFDPKDPYWEGEFDFSLAITTAGFGHRILFNQDYVNDPARYQAALARSANGHFTVSTPTGMALHEFGHVLGYQTQVHTTSKKIASAMAASAGEKPSKLVERELGEYAKASNLELTAEAITDVLVRGDGASAVSKAIFEEVDRRYDARTPGAGRRAAERQAP